MNAHRSRHDLVISALFCPANRPDRCLKATRSGADLVIVDLEDSIAPAGKAAARVEMQRLLVQRTAVPLCPRINAIGSPWFADDVEVLAASQHFSQVMMPKVQTPDEVAALRGRMPGVRVRVLIENAVGIRNMAAIAATDGVLSMGIGEADLASELGITDPKALEPIRVGLVVACRAAGLPAPMMSAYTDLNDDGGLVAACRRARGQGFLGAQVVHPRQVPLVVDAFTPGAAEVRGAQEVLATLAAAAEHGSSVAVLQSGAMVDAAMARGAQLTLELASQRSRRPT